MLSQSNANTRQQKTIRRLAIAILAGLSLACLSISLHLAWASNYGGYNDVYLMLDTFLRILHNGDYSPSRFTGYPAAEIGIGTLAWLGGSQLSNVVTYGLFAGSAALFPLCFSAQVRTIRYCAFLAMTLSSPVMAFDNVQSIDYPWSLFFWVLGCLCLRRCSDRMLAVIPLAISIGCRPAFTVFVLASILLIDDNESKERIPLLTRIRQRWGAMLTVIFSGCLFYLPAWLSNGFSLDWVSAVAPDNQGAMGVLARFAYKTGLAIGFVPLLVIAIALAWLLLAKRNKTTGLIDLPREDRNFLAAIMAINLLIFLRIPAQQSYLQPFLFCFYFGLSRLSGRVGAAFAIVIAGLNFTVWFMQPQLLSIRYKSKDRCAKVEAEGAAFRLAPGPGRLDLFMQVSSKATCYAPWFRDFEGIDYSNAVLQGKPLRLVKDKRQQDKQQTQLQH